MWKCCVMNNKTKKSDGEDYGIKKSNTGTTFFNLEFIDAENRISESIIVFSDY